MSNPLFTMSFTELDSKINDGLDSVATLVPYLQEMRERLHSQGKRTDLPDTPKGMTWTAWVASKKSRLKMSIRTVQRVLEGPRTSRQVDAKSVFEELASRLNALVPSLSDGVEHKTVSLLQQAPESVTSDLNEYSPSGGSYLPVGDCLARLCRVCERTSQRSRHKCAHPSNALSNAPRMLDTTGRSRQVRGGSLNGRTDGPTIKWRFDSAPSAPI